MLNSLNDSAVAQSLALECSASKMAVKQKHTESVSEVVALFPCGAVVCLSAFSLLNPSNRISSAPLVPYMIKQGHLT